MLNLINSILVGDSQTLLKEIPDGFADLIITSPPYFGLRNYKVGENVFGAEIDPNEYIDRMVALFCGDLHRILKDTGCLYLNIGDKYYCSQMGFHRGYVKKYKREIHQHYKKMPILPAKVDNYRQNKQLLQIPTRISCGMAGPDGNWILRNELIWVKGHYGRSNNGTPVEGKDRYMIKSEERIFLFTKKPKNYTHNKQMERKLRSGGFPGVKIDGSIIYCQRENYTKHQASFPEKLIEPFIHISSNPGDMVLDPFSGSGTVAVVAKRNGRKYCGIDLSKSFCRIAEERLKSVTLPQGKVYTIMTGDVPSKSQRS